LVVYFFGYYETDITAGCRVEYKPIYKGDMIADYNTGAGGRNIIKTTEFTIIYQTDKELGTKMVNFLEE